MPEQGPTEEEVEVFRQAVYVGGPGCGCDHIGYTCDACYRRGLAAVATLTRARHVREAVEAMPDAVLAGLGTQIRYAATYGIARAALLDALGGTDTTTPNPQNRP